VSGRNQFDIDLDRTDANYAPLTPLTFIAWSAQTYPQRTAVVHGERRFTWAETYARCRRLASALSKQRIGLGDTVAVMLANTPEMYEAHFGVPTSGAVLNTLNTRLDADAIAFMLNHGQAKVLITDREFAETIRHARAKLATQPLLIDVNDPEYDGAGESLGGTDYESFLAGGDPEFGWLPPADEWHAISLNYTSGTTGNPKGVVYHHRGAYLNGICNLLQWSVPRHAVYLWTLPMFHCNGWCFPWSVTALAGTHVCLRRVEAGAVYDAIERDGVTHLCGAPIVMNMLLNARSQPLPRPVNMMTAGAAPPAAVIGGMEALGFRITHVYGLTEVYGPAVVCAWHDEWDALSDDERARLKSRQGVPYPVLEGLTVGDPDTLAPVPSDGVTMGEVFMRGNIVTKGYLKNPAATEEAFEGGWFHSGDLAVMHPDGYIEIKDRSKDIIISGGENISTIEVEDVLYRHPAVLEAAVVAKPDPNWGETPCAFVTLKDGAQAEPAEIIAFCRGHMAHFKAPRHVIFGPLPKTSTGKIQKFVLRERAKAAG